MFSATLLHARFLREPDIRDCLASLYLGRCLRLESTFS
jgi:hypothetical protein